MKSTALDCTPRTTTGTSFRCSQLACGARFIAPGLTARRGELAARGRTRTGLCAVRHRPAFHLWPLGFENRQPARSFRRPRSLRQQHVCRSSALRWGCGTCSHAGRRSTRNLLLADDPLLGPHNNWLTRRAEPGRLLLAVASLTCHHERAVRDLLPLGMGSALGTQELLLRLSGRGLQLVRPLGLIEM